MDSYSGSIDDPVLLHKQFYDLIIHSSPELIWGNFLSLKRQT